MVDATFFTVLKVGTTIMTLARFASPAPDVYRIYKTKRIVDVSVVPLVSLFSCSFVWAVYGLLMNSIVPVVVTSVAGALATTLYIVVYYLNTPHRSYVLKLVAGVSCLLACVTAYAVLGAAHVTGQTRKEVGTVVGYMCVTVNVILYASPFETIVTVVRTKNASSLPILFCFVGVLNSTLWVLFSILDNDMFILIPNTIGVVCSAVQVSLYIKYRPGKHAQRQHDGAANEIDLSEVVVVTGPPKTELGDSYSKLATPRLESLRPSATQT